MEKSIHLYESKHNEQYSLTVHHHEFSQLLYVIEGTGTIIIDDITYDIEQHTAALIVPHSVHAVSSKSKLTLLVLAFKDEATHEPMHLEWKEHSFQKSELLKLNSLVSNELRLLLRKLLFEEMQEDRFSSWAIRIHLHEIILLLARAKDTFLISDANSLRGERVRNFIDSHYYETITSATLAMKTDMSIRHLNATFKERYRITPMQYLAEVRIDIAKKLLSETDKDIVSICFEIGYESLPTFYRTFKNLVHQSPNQYRHIHQANKKQ